MTRGYGCVAFRGSLEADERALGPGYLDPAVMNRRVIQPYPMLQGSFSRDIFAHIVPKVCLMICLSGEMILERLRSASCFELLGSFAEVLTQ